MPDKKDYLDTVNHANYIAQTGWGVSQYLHVMELHQNLKSQNLLCFYINM
jgi:hypothetical protein